MLSPCSVFACVLADLGFGAVISGRARRPRHSNVPRLGGIRCRRKLTTSTYDAVSHDTVCVFARCAMQEGSDFVVSADEEDEHGGEKVVLKKRVSLFGLLRRRRRVDTSTATACVTLCRRGRSTQRFSAVLQAKAATATTAAVTKTTVIWSSRSMRASPQKVKATCPYVFHSTMSPNHVCLSVAEDLVKRKREREEREGESVFEKEQRERREKKKAKKQPSRKLCFRFPPSQNLRHGCGYFKHVHFVSVCCNL